MKRSRLRGRADSDLNILLKEYDTLRQEIHVTMEARNQILTFGFATIGLVLTAASFGENAPVQPLVFAGFSFAIPSLSVFLLYLWLADYTRMRRAHFHIVRLERRINALVDSECATLTWEQERDALHKDESFVDSALIMQLAFSILVLFVPLGGCLIAEVDLFDYWWAGTPWFLLPLAAVVIHFNRYLLRSKRRRERSARWATVSEKP